MGLDHFPPFYKDPLFLSALGAAILFWFILGLYNGAWHPMQAREVLSSRFLFLSLLQPLIEELLFRGFLQSQWIQTQWGKSSWLGFSAANLMTSLLFTLGHFASHPPAWAIAVFFPSIIFGYFRERHDSLYPSIFLHVFYNAGYFFLIGLP
jgi:membrane protease YdiL (CAAX protease family)